MSILRKTRGIHLRDTRANQPAATAVLAGTLYYVTDESVLERSSGSAWESISSSGSSSFTDLDDVPTAYTGEAGNIVAVNATEDALEFIAAPESDPPVPTEQTTTATGDQNNFDLNTRYTYLRCTGAAPVFSGFTVNGAAPQAGDTVVIDCLGTTVKVVNQDTDSTDVNRIITPSTTGQIIGLGGRMTLVYDGTTDRWRESLNEPGVTIAVPYSASDFTGAGSMTWTVASGDVSEYAYRQYGRLLWVSIQILGSSVGGTLSNALHAALPNGFTIAVTTACFAVTVDNGTIENGRIAPSTVTPTVLRFVKPNAGNWATSTDNTSVTAQGWFAIN